MGTSTFTDYVSLLAQEHSNSYIYAVPGLKPLFPYLGSKSRSIGEYPPPRNEVVVEPFAGSALYAHRYYDRQVVLVERDPKVAAVWRWLLHPKTTPALVRCMPVFEPGERISPRMKRWPDGARWLVGFWAFRGMAQARDRMRGRFYSGDAHQ